MSSPQKLSHGEVLALRQQGGKWLRELRTARGLSQRDLAARVGLEYYTYISQMEAGRGRMPPDQFRAWAAALGVEPRLFVKTWMRFYDPATYEILFED